MGAGLIFAQEQSFISFHAKVEHGRAAVLIVDGTYLFLRGLPLLLSAGVLSIIHNLSIS